MGGRRRSQRCFLNDFVVHAGGDLGFPLYVGDYQSAEDFAKGGMLNVPRIEGWRDKKELKDLALLLAPLFV